jgi:hypothetical protein
MSRATMINNILSRLKGALPHSPVDAAVDFGTNGLFSAFAMSQADPEYRLRVGAEDLAYGIGGSMLGRGLTRFAGRKMFGVADEARLRGVGDIGSMVGDMGLSIFAPRPQVEAMYRARENAGQGQPERDPLTGLPAEEAARIAQNQALSSLLVGANALYTVDDLPRLAGGL